VVERDSIDIEHLRGTTLIPAAFFDDLQDVSALDVIKSHTPSCRGRCGLGLEDEIALVQFRLLSYNHGTLDGVLEFSNITEPRLLL
jgi:hypothetical protein